ncbi:DUF3810 domain-containing protein [Gelidibacter salicanalis]|uniref:DUF3810 domain-containing protein n=1 Tax=Gelidibacter salicanalis TaxID=291193 RepID=A0A934NG96_9FLAO|nr:DUF3810 domain-containing protein [Gelidibacter salicanalis]MBJ7879316.1 DUF3810 domain-containing protein [Gelidibacter salicanalis]
MRKHTKLIIALSLPLQIVLIKVLANFPEVVERYYSNGIYKWISKAMHVVLGWIPFSVGDIFYTMAAVYSIRWIYKNRKRLRTDTKNYMLDILSTVSLGYFAFHILWAFNYYRLPLHQSLKIENEYSTEQLIRITQDLITKTNVIHGIIKAHDTSMVIMPYTKKELIALAPKGYAQLSKEYPNLAYGTSSLKRSIYSLPLTYMGFSGYLNPFTNEAQIDGLIPAYKYPTTTSHEIAHQLGYAAENEANFIGAMAAMKHENIYFNYSGYSFALRHCLNDIYLRDPITYEALIMTVNIGVLKNYEETRLFWQSYENVSETFFKNTYSGFLMANNQKGGIESYSYIVALLVNYFDKRPL